MSVVESGLRGFGLFIERSEPECKRFLGIDCHWIADSVNWTCLGTSGISQVFARWTCRNVVAGIWTETKSFESLAIREVGLTLVVVPHLARRELWQRLMFHPPRNFPQICFRLHLMRSRPQSAFLQGQDLRVWKSIKLSPWCLPKMGC